MTTKAKKPRGIVLTDREVRALRGDRLTLLVRPVRFGARGVMATHGDTGESWPHVRLPKRVLGRTVARPMVCPLGAPGERRFVCEQWARTSKIEGQGPIVYAADGVRGCWGGDGGGGRIFSHHGWTVGITPTTWPDGSERRGAWFGRPKRWAPAIHMPAWASRDTIEIASVEVRRVQSVTEDEARACDFDVSIVLPGDATSRIPAFGDEWARKYGTDSWDRNDWAWFVDVRRVAEERSAA